MDLTALGGIQLRDKIREGTLTCFQVTSTFLEKIKTDNHNAVLEYFPDALERAKLLDEREDKSLSLFGIPFLIKDNILIKGKIASAGSKFLKDFVSPYSATVIEKLHAAGAIFLGRTNMDEFAMGSSTENSAFAPCLNAIDPQRVSGGSSGGSAAAVKLNLCAAALGTDTGGSVRQPAAFNGVVGLKPTYGKVSRYGVIAFASSFDQVGPITKNIEDSILITNIISGKDERDSTSVQTEAIRPERLEGFKSFKVGMASEIYELLNRVENRHEYLKLIDFLKVNAADFKIYPTEDFKLCLPVYYILSTAELTSNLGRFDGIKYTKRNKKARDINEIYTLSRSEGFGKEAKRRIMLGNYVLSSGYFDAYYLKAKKLQQKLVQQVEKIFDGCDILISPTTLGGAFKLGSKTNDPLKMYAEDIFTVVANVTELPALSIPFGHDLNNMPTGLQIMSKKGKENKIFTFADLIQRQFKDLG